MIKALKKLAHFGLNTMMKSFLYEELEQLIETSFQQFSDNCNALATKNNIDLEIEGIEYRNGTILS